MTKQELFEFDWFGFKSEATVFKPNLTSIMQLKEPEFPFDRKLRMLKHLSTTCTACSMCELGLKPAIKNDESRDPHVLSNLNPTRFMVIGQNPGWNEICVREPFIGAAGKNFNEKITKHGLSRDDFYICNVVRCFTAGNVKPSAKNVERCSPFLRIEINLLKPKLVVALGAVAFAALCPDAVFSDSLKRIVKSSVYDVPVFAIYHPSPLNFIDNNRMVIFEDQIKVLCALVKKLKD